MAKSAHIIGLEPAELAPVRVLVSLLRHPDPSIGELSRQALFYLQDVAVKREQPEPQVLNNAG